MERADKILQALFERLNIRDEHGYARLFTTWRSVCDEVSSRGLADHSSIVDVRHGAIIVAVDHPGWLQLLQFYHARLLDKLQRRFPELGLTAIHYHISERRVDLLNAERSDAFEDRGQPDSEGIGAEREAKDQRPGQESAKDDDELLTRIGNESFRESLARLRREIEERE